MANNTLSAASCQSQNAGSQLFRFARLTYAITEELLHRGFERTEIKLFVWVMNRTLKWGGRWLTIRGGVTRIAKRLKTNRQQVIAALDRLCAPVSGRVFWRREVGRRLSLRLNPKPSDWGKDFESRLSVDQIREINRDVSTDTDDKQLVWDEIDFAGLEEELPDTILAQMLARCDVYDGHTDLQTPRDADGANADDDHKDLGMTAAGASGVVNDRHTQAAPKVGDGRTDSASLIGTACEPTALVPINVARNKRVWPCGKEEERRIFKLLTDTLRTAYGERKAEHKREMAHSGAWHRINVRWWPSEIERALGELRYRLKTSQCPDNPAAWFQSELRMYVGEERYDKWREQRPWHCKESVKIEKPEGLPTLTQGAKQANPHRSKPTSCVDTPAAQKKSICQACGQSVPH